MVTNATNHYNVVNVTFVTNTTKCNIVANVTIFAGKFTTIDMGSNKNNDALIGDLRKKDSFDKSDLRAWYAAHGIDMTEENLRVRIHRWKAKGVLQTVASGKYTIGQKPNYTPIPDKFIRKVNKLFLSSYDELDYCIWSTQRLMDLMLHIPVRYFYVLETEKDATETIFHYFKENGINAYYHPNQDQIYRYVVPEADAIIVRPLISRSPCQMVEKVRMPLIEKILVDLYCDTEIFYAYGGSELIRIYENVLLHYTVNFTRLLGYAERRKKNKEIKAFMLDNFEELVKNILT